MKLESLEIILDNKEGIFNPGDSVSGHVLVILKEQMKLRTIRLELLGEMKVGFWQQHGSGKNSVAIHYTSQETYVKSEETLWTPQISEFLPAGSHQFTFELRIPSDCPTSLESKRGKIRYGLKVVLDRPWKFDHLSELIFTVINPINLNDNLLATVPVVKSAKKTLMLSSGDLKVDVKLLKVGFVAGERIPVHIEITNGTTRDVKGVVVKLLRNASYTGYFIKQHGSFTQVKTKTITKLKKNEEIPAGKSCTFVNEFLNIPVVCPSIQNCKHLQLSYVVLVEILPSGPSFTLDVEIPIIVGTVPIRSNFSTFQPNFGYEIADNQGSSNEEPV